MPKTFHLDKRASALLLNETTDPEALLDTSALAEWLGVSRQWAEISRVRGYGPPYLRLAPKVIRYRVGDVKAWLAERASSASPTRSGEADHA